MSQGSYATGVGGDTDRAVLASIERDLLRPEIVERAIEFAIDELRPDSDATQWAEIFAEIGRLDAELSRLPRRSRAVEVSRRSWPPSRNARRSASDVSAP